MMRLLLLGLAVVVARFVNAVVGAVAAAARVMIRLCLLGEMLLDL